MRRRDFVKLLVGLAAGWPTFACAQSQGRPWRIGFVVGGKAAPADSPYSSFARGMRDLGHVEGKDFVIEWRSAEGQYARFPMLARELVQLKVDVIVVSSSAAVRPLQQVMGTVPIVMVYSTDPVGSGLVASLSRPGGNTTGLAGASDDISPKQIELLSRTLPNLSRIGVLGNPDNPDYVPVLKSTETAALDVGMAPFPVEARSAAELEQAFARLKDARAQAVKVIPDAMLFSQRARVADLALAHGLPSIFVQRECAEAGGLMSYGERLTDFFARAAAFVDKIGKGAKPGNLPIEQPNRFEFVVNLGTARALGVEISPNLVALADEVIE
jgi:putative tryptophan/tyrosine transport system substrate-binding protein